MYETYLYVDNIMSLFSVALKNVTSFDENLFKTRFCFVQFHGACNSAGALAACQ